MRERMAYCDSSVGTASEPRSEQIGEDQSLQCRGLFINNSEETKTVYLTIKAEVVQLTLRCKQRLPFNVHISHHLEW